MLELIFFTISVIPRENIDYGEANRQIFDSTDKMVFSGVVDISGRSLRVGEGQPMLPVSFLKVLTVFRKTFSMCELNLFQDDSAAHIINYSLTDSKKEANKTIT